MVISFMVRDPKNKENRTVPLLSKAVPFLIRYLTEVRPDLGKGPWLFPSPRGFAGRATTGTGHVSIRSMQLHVERIRDVVGMKELTPHYLRHSYATALAEAGVNHFTMMAILGHKNISTTTQYVHFSPEALQDAVDKLPATWLKGARDL